MKMNKWFTTAATAALLLGTVSSSAYAFNDIKDVPQSNKIQELRERGIVNGIGKGLFAPHAAMSSQQAIPLIVKAFNLNVDHIRFIKEPQTTDYFANIPNDAWYAEAFVVAHLNGLPLDRELQPDDEVTREQFAKWLMHAVHTKGEFALIQMYVILDDESNVSEGYMGAIQEVLLTGIAELDNNRNFRPLDAITRAEAAIMVRNAIQFVDDHIPNAHPPKEDPVSLGEVGTSIVKINDEIQKITLDWGEKPHPGWGISIQGIDFTEHHKAVIRYKLHYPDPAALYPMVISYPKAVTYLDANITDIEFELAK